MPAAKQRLSKIVSRVRARLHAREVHPGWTAVLVPLPLVVVVALGSYSGNALGWIQARVSLAWVAALALPILAFAAGYAATEPAPPLAARESRPPIIRRLGGARVFALSLLCGCFYVLASIAAYAIDPSNAGILFESTWWGIPFSLCLWTLAAIEFSHETESAGEGRPADPSRQWKWFLTWRRLASARRIGYVALFTSTLAITAVGSIPGLLWRSSADQSVAAWRGQGIVLTQLYFAIFIPWALVLVVAAALFLTHSFRARPAALPDAVLRRAWYSLWAACALIVVVMFFGLASLGWLATPLIDVAMALYVVCFVLMLVDASATTRHRRVKSSVPRRAIGATIVSAIAFGFPAALGGSPFRAALAAGFIAGVIPVFPTLLRLLFGIDRMPAAIAHERRESIAEERVEVAPYPLDDRQRDALYELLVAGPTKEPRVWIDPRALDEWRDCLEQIRSITMPTANNVPKSHPFVFVLFTCDDGLVRTKKWTVPDDLVVLLERLFPGDLDDQKRALIDLMRRSAAHLTTMQQDSYVGTAPSAMEMLEAECIARISGVPAEPAERQRWERLRDMRREWLFGRAEEWSGSIQDVVGSGDQGNYKKSRGGARADRLARACPELERWWLDNLTAAILDASAQARLPRVVGND